MSVACMLLSGLSFSARLRGRKTASYLLMHLQPSCTCASAARQLAWEAQPSVSAVPSTSCPGRLPWSSAQQGFCLRWLGLTATFAAELEQTLLASMTDEESQLTGPPPASKYAVRHLQKETLTEERLRQLGASDGVQCAVCRSVFGPTLVSGWGTGLQACPQATHCHVGLHALLLSRLMLPVCSCHGQAAAHQARHLSYLRRLQGGPSGWGASCCHAVP